MTEGCFVGGNAGSEWEEDAELKTGGLAPFR